MNKLTPITSATNPLVKKLRALATSKKARQESGTFIIEGWRGLETLLAHRNPRFVVEQLIITPEWENDPRRPSSVATVLLSAPLFNKISDVKNAQGILGVVRHTANEFSIEPAAAKYLLLDNIRDPGNLGTLIRSAVGAGFRGILLYGDCVEPFNPKVIRSTMGTFACCDLWPIDQSHIDRIMEAGYEICVTSGAEGENLYHTEFAAQSVLVIGSEAHGVSGELFACATKKITIPLQAECESLNAAVAGSICMFQITQTAG